MAATKIDSLFEGLIGTFKAMILEDGPHALSEEEAVVISNVIDEIVDVWDDYLDRLIVNAAGIHPAPLEAVIKAGADSAELIAAQERVADKLMAQGFPVGLSKKKMH